MVDYNAFLEKTQGELIIENDKLEKKYTEIETDCLKEGLSYEAFCEKAHDVKEKLFFIDKAIRLKSEPVLTYGKEWKGKLYGLDVFKSMCLKGEILTDEDGIGYYATEKTKSDIEVRPSDFKYDLYRTDFTHVLWFDK